MENKSKKAERLMSVALKNKFALFSDAFPNIRSWIQRVKVNMSDKTIYIEALDVLEHTEKGYCVESPVIAWIKAIQIGTHPKDKLTLVVYDRKNIAMYAYVFSSLTISGGFLEFDYDSSSQVLQEIIIKFGSCSRQIDVKDKYPHPKPDFKIA